MMLGWLHTLTTRERGLLGVGLLVSCAAMAFLMVIEPMKTRKAQAERAWAQVSDDANWLKGKSAELAALGARRPAASAASTAPTTVAALEAALRQTDFAQQMIRLAPQPDGQVQIAFENVSYLALMRWMLNTGLAQTVQTLTVGHNQTPDLVDATMTVDLTPPEPRE
jgi:type II secretory pathway component PulM